MPRYFIDIRYVGSRYCGWQRQLTGVSIQEVVEDKLSLLLRSPVIVVGSGRTDAGVHAIKQVAHFDYAEDLPSKFIYRINGMLPPEIAIYNPRIAVKPNLHARYQAVFREYVYYLSRIKNPMTFGKSWLFTQPLDLSAMQALGNLLISYTDFSALCKHNPDVKSTICHIHFCSWEDHQENWVFKIRANRFLWGMVRTIVGLMVDVGRRKISLSKAEEIILSKDRQSAPMAAPAYGLFLSDVAYPPESFLEIPAR